MSGQKITPHLWFDTQAAEAADYYASVFPDSAIIHKSTIDGTPSGKAEMVTFRLSGQEFMAISAGPVFKFNEAISFIVHCKDQKEIDYYWEKLSAVPAAEQCGWCKDKFGVSWQIVPDVMDQMMTNGSKDQIQRVTQAFLKMKKFDIKKLQDAYNKP